MIAIYHIDFFEAVLKDVCQITCLAIRRNQGKHILKESNPLSTKIPTK
jgi:hypothetical protein